MDNNRLYLLALNRAARLAPRERLVLWEMFGAGSPAAIFRLSKTNLAQVLKRRITTDWWQPELFLRQAAADLQQEEHGQLHLVTWTDGHYPPLLRMIFDPPLVLYYRGRLPDWQVPLVGIVGTRHPTGAACTAAFRLGWDLSRRGLGVISGLARGIDNEAHAGSLEGESPRLAVLGNGIDHIYPVTSRPLARKILEKGGCILSEYPPGTPPLKYNFPGRNRIISGLARMVVVVQAPEHSGALITADYALEQGRELVVHKAGLAGPAGAGTRRLCEEGAEAIETAEDILLRWTHSGLNGAWTLTAQPGLVAAPQAISLLKATCARHREPPACCSALQPDSDNLFADDYLTKNLDFVNLKQAGLILAKLMERELTGKEGNKAEA